ncbi:hypothetical protein P2G88_01160 [Aliiglaciecola sp. CAU 1673]|uniref:hypothetical protein n=1 Tax=Aliiglaciecola sp. CAU 1673 TaxID=3032595 RepID=UPI0023DCB3F3|nr:hypothetical protein [Aliiglaciecola sp. CAU 1673]MDF2176859.1 hypothetical protein [Aliiglaciecola sp. CAU 1673]
MSVKSVRWSVFIALSSLIYFGNLHLIQPSNLKVDWIALSMLLDLVVWVPLLYYFLLMRQRLAPALLMRPLVMAGVLCCLWMTPPGSFLEPVKSSYPYVLAGLASLAATYTLFTFTLAWHRSQALSGEPRVAYLAEAVGGRFGLTTWLQSEWLAFYYALRGWGLKTSADNQTSFSYHVKSGAVGLLIGSSLFHIPGIIFSHIIFHHISPLIAWLLTAGHLYTMFLTLSQAMAIKHRHIQLSDEGMLLRCGLLFDCQIPWQQIDSVSRVAMGCEEKAPDLLRAYMLGHVNLEVRLKSAQKVSLLAGISKQVTRIHLGLDDPQAFIRRCEEHQAD